MSSFCGLRPLRLKKTRVISEHANSLLNFAAEHSVTPTTATFFQATATTTSPHSNQNFDPNNDYSSREGTSGKGKHHDWARDDQLSIILEVLDAETKRTPGNELEELNWGPPKPPKSRHQYKGGHTLANVREVPGEESPTTDLVPLDSKAKGKYIAGSRDHSPHPTIPPKSANRTARVDNTTINTEKDRNINKPDELKEYIVGAPPGHRPVLMRRKGDKLLVQTPGSSRDLVLRQQHPQHRPHHRQQEFLWNGTGNRYRKMESRGESSRTGRGEPVRRPSFDTSAPVTPQSSKSEPRAIQAPPRDLESIARIDASLVFEHFTTTDAWELGCALRTRLLPISTPVVIDISLANQDQTLFHTCTHSGIMPDNDSWVARKRRTVLRWGVSTWYMSCKFGGDERAFAIKYGLGEKGGEYAIHGGGVPIRVRGVEGVVAVVVVSGLKQDEDHGVIVECIRELYY